MKIKFLVLILGLVFVSQMSASNYSSGVTLTLTDIKEALYGLLEDTRSNIKSIDGINKNIYKIKQDNNNSKNKLVKIEDSYNENIKKINNNTKSIEKINDTILLIVKDINKLQEDKILYKNFIQKFIDENQNLLDEKK